MRTNEELKQLSLKQVYEWVKTKHWSFRDFETWMKAINNENS
jgi:hypothetical protein